MKASWWSWKKGWWRQSFNWNAINSCSKYYTLLYSRWKRVTPHFHNYCFKKIRETLKRIITKWENLFLLLCVCESECEQIKLREFVSVKISRRTNNRHEITLIMGTGAISVKNNKVIKKKSAVNKFLEFESPFYFEWERWVWEEGRALNARESN
jgi:hypothetical protein